jgi:glycerol-3-phosphate dehydrogenase
MGETAAPPNGEGMNTTSRSTTLGPEHRARSLRRMREETFDVAIVGGGVTGTGAALDAATRGLSVALIEQRDWAAGTSSSHSCARPDANRH